MLVDYNSPWIKIIYVTHTCLYFNNRYTVPQQLQKMNSCITLYYEMHVENYTDIHKEKAFCTIVITLNKHTGLK